MLWNVSSISWQLSKQANGIWGQQFLANLLRKPKVKNIRALRELSAIKCQVEIISKLPGLKKQNGDILNHLIKLVSTSKLIKLGLINWLHRTLKHVANGMHCKTMPNKHRSCRYSGHMLCYIESNKMKKNHVTGPLSRESTLIDAIHPLPVLQQLRPGGQSRHGQAHQEGRQGRAHQGVQHQQEEPSDRPEGLLARRVQSLRAGRVPVAWALGGEDEEDLRFYA